LAVALRCPRLEPQAETKAETAPSGIRDGARRHSLMATEVSAQSPAAADDPADLSALRMGTNSGAAINPFPNAVRDETSTYVHEYRPSGIRWIVPPHELLIGVAARRDDFFLRIVIPLYLFV